MFCKARALEIPKWNCISYWNKNLSKYECFCFLKVFFVNAHLIIYGDVKIVYVLKWWICNILNFTLFIFLSIFQWWNYSKIRYNIKNKYWPIQLYLNMLNLGPLLWHSNYTLHYYTNVWDGLYRIVLIAES